MGRSEPCVLFAQTFVHPQLDEYVDEVIFAEPVIITACEFLEQNAASASQAVSLVGATSPPSFALEVFVRCEGESKFKRLCNPFLYTSSAPYPLEVEAVVTNHLVVRGTYRSLSLVIYGNIVKDLGQYNIILEGRSVTDIVSSAEGNLEDLPLVLHSVNRTVEECLSSLSIVSLPMAASDFPVEVKQLLQLMLKIFQLLDHGVVVHKAVDAILSAVSSYIAHNLEYNEIDKKHLAADNSGDSGEFHSVFGKAKEELLCLFEVHQSGKPSSMSSTEFSFLESEVDLATSKELVGLLSRYFHFKGNSSDFGHPQLSEGKNILLGLNVALLLCLGREGCFHFVNARGMEYLMHLFGHNCQKSSAITLLLLGVIEQATRHSVGCEGFLGWWPREDGNIPSGRSEGYNLLLKLLMQNPCHDVASLATYILRRLRIYEVASRYEFAVLSALGSLSAVVGVANMLHDAKSQLQKLLKLINSFGTIEDPSPSACANRSLIFCPTEGLLSYEATNEWIASSNCCFSTSEIDSHVLALLKERGFLPLSAALLSTSTVRSEVADPADVFTDIALFTGKIVLSFMFSRSGLNFLLHQPHLAATVIQALKGSDDLSKEECVPIRYASSLISKGFACSSQEVGMILEMHLRVVNAVDRLLKSTPQTEEFLWVLWELRGLSRSDCGRQALLALGFFPEVISILIEALHSVKEMEPTIENNGTSPLSLAIFHSAAEIFEVIVSDPTASSLHSWIKHAAALHKALHSSSPGSNRKDAPARLLKWIDAGVVYHKHGAIGLLRYAAVLASGGDAQLSSTSILALDLTQAENVVGESSSVSEMNVLENLGKVIFEKSFDGVSLSDSSISQLTTTLRILAFISENSTVAAALYDEGAVTVVYAVLVNCSFMLEKSSNIYAAEKMSTCTQSLNQKARNVAKLELLSKKMLKDFQLVDLPFKRRKTSSVDLLLCFISLSDFLLERNREQSLVDLLVPTLVLLISLLRKLQEAMEQHRNTKLMNAMLRLHREVSTKLAACAADLSSHYPDSALGFGAVCHLVVSALASWPVYGWIPGLFHSLLSSVQTTSVLALGPKETCSLLCLLSDLFPEEGITFWKNGMPLLSGLRTLAIGTLLGPQKEREIYWYLEPGPLEKLINHLTPHLDKIAQIVRHHAVSALSVIQDMLRVFIVRIACQKVELASALLQPVLSSVRESVSDFSSTVENGGYKVYRCLDFLASVLEHPRAKALLLEEGVVQLLMEVLGRCYDAFNSGEKAAPENRHWADFSFGSWCIPVFKSVSLLCSSRASLPCFQRKELLASLSTKECSLILPFILNFCRVLPIGRELLSCLRAYKDLVSCSEGQEALFSSLLQFSSSSDEFESERRHERTRSLNLLNDIEMEKSPPLLSCLVKLLKSINSNDGMSTYVIEAVNLLCLGSLRFCICGKSLDSNRVAALKFLFGLPSDMSGMDAFPEENINFVEELTTLSSSKAIESESSATSDLITYLYETSELPQALLMLLQKSTGVEVEDIISSKVLVSPKIFQIESIVSENVDDYLSARGFEDKFCWECPETLPERLSQSTLPSKRKMPPVEGSNRRAKGENLTAEIATQNAMPWGLGPTALSCAPTRRDSFRQRKPNTSRPPSMHVDDYVARERTVDTGGASNAITIPRVGSSSGRPPSIHVDEFMARQRERGQNASSVVVGEAVAQVKTTVPASVRANTEKVNGKSKQLKTDLDDDLQGIDIVFDGEESEESDDKLPFIQPDDNLLQTAPVIPQQNSPHSIVEETESDGNGSSQFPQMGTPLASNVDENAQSEFSSRMSISCPEIPLTRESSVSSDRKFEAEDTRKVIPLKNHPGASESRFTPVYNNIPASSGQLPTDSSRMGPQSFYPKDSPKHAGNIHARGIYDQKAMPNQRPLPPMPPPASVSPVIPHSSESVSNQSSPFVNPGTPIPGGSIRPMPPLPSTPPPFSSNPYASLPPRTPTPPSFAYNQTGSVTSELPQNSSIIDSQLATGMTSYPPPLIPTPVFSRPPSSVPMPYYGNTPSQQAGEKPPSLLQPQINSQSVPQIQPMQLQRPLQPPQHIRPPMQTSQPSSDHGMSMQNPFQIPMHPLQMMQHAQQVPQIQQPYYQSPQQQEIPPVRQQQPLGVQHQQGASMSQQQQQESGMSLHDYFKSPEAIQLLLSDKDKLCQLLEHHPKLMQMLQERLGQL